jgi:hypothetical protein
MLMELLEALGYVLDTPGSLMRGVMGGRPGERLSGRDLFEQWGLLGENQEGFDMGDVAGFAGDVLLDPLNFIGGGLLTKAVKGKNAAKAANVGIDASNAASKAAQASNEASMAMRARGWMPEEVAKATKIVDETGNPKRMYHGTPHPFDSFDTNVLNPESLYGPGIYTTDSPKVASKYSTGKSSIGYQSPRPLVSNEVLAKELESLFSTMPDENVRKLFSPLTEDVAITVEEGRERLLEHLRAEGPGGWHSVLEEAGIERPDLYTKGYHPEVAPNVRMQYVDARNPLDLEDFVNDDASARFKSFFEQLDIDPTLRKEVYEEHSLGPSANAGVAMEVLRMFTGKPEAELAKQFGYDAVLHRGGVVTGGVPHNVAIALDPSQIYKPYIAPALQEVSPLQSHLPVPGIRNPLLALLGYNVAKQPGGM